MGRLGIIVGSVLVVSMGSGCVGLSEHHTLKNQFEKQEAYVKRHKKDVQQASRETTRVAMKLREKELEVQRLEEQNKDLKYQLVRVAKKPAPTPAPAPASFSKSPAAKAKPQPASTAPGNYALTASSPRITGFKVNNKSNGIVLDQAKIFSTGSAKIKASGRKALSKLAKVFNSAKYRNNKIRVEGHTDTDPITRSKSIRDNWELSGMRARAVLNYLESKGVSSTRLSFAGYSFHKPFTSDKSKAGKVKNRRVEILLFD
jgi:chemotaxis protein MotB